ncbi:MAG: hypothetical protein ACSHYB_05525 [Roseibacillus sp.]
MVRTFLRGAFANTAFCILAPDGETRLSKSGRGPSSLLGRRGGAADDPEALITVLKKIAGDYRAKGAASEAVVQDFHTSRQALNVASGDQRLLLLTVSSKEERRRVTKVLQAVLNDSEVVGRFHHDFAEKSSDADWAELVAGEKSQAGYFVIQADAFGQEGKVLGEFSLSATSGELKKALEKANAVFAKAEQRKVYREHVQEGRRKGVHFKNEIPYGEDRDGDGVIDEKPGRGRRGR